MDNCKLCLNNKNVRSEYVYYQTFLSDKCKSYRITYEELATDDGFIRAIARFVWTYNPKSKGVAPKVIYPIGQLNYTEFEDLVIDLTNFMKGAIDDEELEVWLKCILEKNIIPNSK
jgi:hypothetical protein